MAQERIDIIVTQKGAQVVRREVEKIGDSAVRAQSGVQLLRRALGFLGAAATVRGIIQLSDQFTNLQNRIRTVTSSTAELNAVTGQLFRIANSTRSSFQTTTEIYARTALAAKDLGISQEQVLSFTESLNQAVILSGASAQEANNAMIQLSQGLASGALRGDELRSVLEQLPVVADVIAKEMGVTRGQLRELGAEGKITADIVLSAFRTASDDLEQRFGKTVPTIGQSLTVLQNNAVKALGSFNEFSGASELLSRGILLLADNVENLARAFAAVSLTIGVSFARKAIPQAIAAMRTFTVAMAANPIGAIAVGLTLAISAAVTFSDKIKIATGSLATLQDVVVVVFQELGPKILEVAGFVVRFLNPAVGLLAKAFEGVDLSISNVLRTTAEAIDIMVGGFKGAAKAIEIAFTNLPSALELLFVNMFNKLVKLNEMFLNKLIDGLNFFYRMIGVSLIPAFEGTFLEASAKAQELGRQMNTAILEGINSSTGVQDWLDSVFEKAEARAAERLAQLQSQSDIDLSGSGEDKTKLSFIDKMLEGLQRVRDGALEVQDVVKNIGDGFAEAASRAIVFGEDFGLAMRQLAGQALQQVISSLIKVGTQMVANAVVAKTLGSAATAATVAEAGVAAAAWATPAALASLATLGSNAIPANAAIASTVGLSNSLAALPGLNDGGDIRIGGAGGVDNNLLSINGQPTARVSRDETIRVVPNGKGGRGGNTYVMDFSNSDAGVEGRVRAVLAELLPDAQEEGAAEMEQNIGELFSREQL